VERVLWGALSEVVLIVANIGTAVVLFSVLKRQHEGLALGYVAARIMGGPGSRRLLAHLPPELLRCSGSSEPGSTWPTVAAMPEFVWELSLGVYLIVKGFKPSPLTLK
jgi:hypothetical protein